MTLPCAAGTSYLDQLMKDDHRKAQRFFYANQERYLAPPSHPLPPTVPSLNYMDLPLADTFPDTTASVGWSNTPSPVFHFGTYVYEDYVHGRPDEQMKVRMFQLAFHLEDETIAIMEQMLNTPNIYDRKFLRRQRVPKHGSADKHLTLYDLNVGKSVIIYGREHFLYKCDEYTRKTMTHMGFEVGDDVPAPVSQFTAISRANKGMAETLHRHINTDFPLAHFLKNDGKVLRFYALYDDRQSMYGDRHFLLLHYYLADNTLEIMRKTPHTSGRSHWTSYVRRGKVPKRPEELGKLQTGSPWPVLNTMPNGKEPIKSYYLFDQAQLLDTAETYTEKDLGCGQSINVFGRLVFLYDCDDFTRWYYKTHYGKAMQPIDVSEPADPTPEALIPPHNGYGLEEDSVQNVYRLIPKPLVNDARKYLGIDRAPDDPLWLTFRLRALTDDPVAEERSYVMKYHLNDDSISINSPQFDWHGKFLEKKHVPKGASKESSLPEYVQPEDLYIGGIVQLREQCYVIAEADESTLKFMEKHPKQFPRSDIALVMQRYRDLLRNQPEVCRRLSDKFSVHSADGAVTHDVFISTLMEATGAALTPHEYTTLLRAYRVHPHVPLDTRRDVYRAFIQRALKRDLYEPRSRLLLACQKYDVSNQGYVSRAEMVRAGWATRLPLPGGVFEDFVELVADEKGVEYGRVVEGLDWVRNPVKKDCPIPDTMGGNFDFNRFFGVKSTAVRYKDFLNDIGCKEPTPVYQPNSFR